MGKNIVLIGFLGVGKTTIGRKLAMQLGRDFYDTDNYIAKSEGMPVSDVVQRKGQVYFTGSERFAVMALMDKPDAVISTGGSTVLDDESRALLHQDSVVVWVRATAETVYQNTVHSPNKRPEIEGKSCEEIGALLAERTPYYGQCDIAVDVDGKDVEHIVSELAEQLAPLL